jgi:predicted nucleic acid-binding protein
VNYLLDTNVVSELGRRYPDRKVAAWANGVDTMDLHLSLLTLGEIAKGVAMAERRDAIRGAALSQWLDGLRREYADRIIGIDGKIAETWGRLSSGRSIPIVDALPAATALVHDLTLVTRNTRDIADIGVRTINPWLA